jgi:cysteine desulfurase/selenocysteine lyase
VHNDAWQEGQASSVRCAVRACGQAGALILIAGDQPFVNEQALWRLVDAYEDSHTDKNGPSSPAPVTAGVAFVSSVGDARGNPALFDASLFDALATLDGDEGARQVFGEVEPVLIGQSDPCLLCDIDDAASLARVREDWVLPPAVRDRFPLLAGGDCAYLDNAATTQVPQAVLDVMWRFETGSRANIHRGIYSLAERASAAYEDARVRVASFFGAETSGVVFTHGATEALNLAAFGWGGANLHEGDLVLVDVAAHHANIVPWQMLVQQTGVRLEFIGCDATGRFDEAAYERLLEQQPRVVALTHVSNVTGTVNNIRVLAARAHAAGAVVVADCAQSAGHIPFDFASSGVDFAVVSAHKMYGPFGIGALLAKPAVLRQARSIMGGGGMVHRVDTSGFAAIAGPGGFEAGTPNITGAVGFAAACDFVETLGIERIERHTATLGTYARGLLAEISGLHILGSGYRVSTVAFTMDGVHPHDIAGCLGEQGVAVRAGHHCAMPLHAALGTPASVRASFAAYSTPAEVDRLVAALQHVKEVFDV